MLTEAGLKRKTYHEIYEEMVAGVSKRLGQDINMSETSPLGMMMQVFAWHLAEPVGGCRAGVPRVVHSICDRRQLDALAVFYGLRRKLEQAAHGRVQMTGTPNYTVQPGLQVGTKSGVWFTTDEACALDESGTGEVTVTAIVPGSGGNVPAGSVTEPAYISEGDCGDHESG